MRDGALVVGGMGGAGSRKGKGAVYCTGDGIYTWDGTTCTVWSYRYGEWDSAPGICGLRTRAGSEEFFYVDYGTEVFATLEGDVIMSDSFRADVAAPQEDLTAAKKVAGL